jgi:hypothetical protein
MLMACKPNNTCPTKLPATAAVTAPMYNQTPLKAISKQAYPDDFANIATANTNPYSETLLENSPLNRPLKQAAPGYDLRTGGEHKIEAQILEFEL